MLKIRDSRFEIRDSSELYALVKSHSLLLFTDPTPVNSEVTLALPGGTLYDPTDAGAATDLQPGREPLS